ncbi:protein kinase [Rubripirellula sp.]|jgi:tRNA A-37 threonylcarbamoyl transferase component Bud32|nr:protein kinase [Planctomycetaceae bacterium]MDA9856748.1 protein kinase [Rubripirellula sp.]
MMALEPETRIHWATQVASIRKRFEEARRAGETFNGFEPWLKAVPEHIRPLLLDQLETCQLDPESISPETSELSADGILSLQDQAREFFYAAPADVTDDAIHRCPTFRGLSRKAVKDLNQNFVQQSFPSGTKLLRQGQAASGLYLILEGSVDIIDATTGEKIDSDDAGSVLGEMSLLTGAACSAEVVATADVQAMVLSTDGYKQLIEKHPELEIALSQLVSDRLGGRTHDALCGKTIGNYEPVRCISRGGMGVVYEARASGEELSDHVALKMLRHRFIYDDQVQNRFGQEASLLEGLVHPNIVRFREHFVAFRTRFLVLDLCDGSDLFGLLRSEGPMAEPMSRAILGQIAEGLLYAHRHGVIHRDLKPGNVLVGRDGRIQLTDFGLSKLIESETAEAKAVGTPAYMPPEQFRPSQVGPACDWYAMGCLAYEMLTAEILFNGQNWMKMFERKKNFKPSEHLLKLNCSDELKNVIQGALEPNEADRSLDLEVISSWADQAEGLFPPEQCD